MARIRILELPMVHLGEASKTPFAVIIDQVATDHDEIRDASDQVMRETVVSELTQTEADEIAVRIGAVGAVLTVCTLDLE